MCFWSGQFILDLFVGSLIGGRWHDVTDMLSIVWRWLAMLWYRRLGFWTQINTQFSTIYDTIYDGESKEGIVQLYRIGGTCNCFVWLSDGNCRVRLAQTGNVPKPSRCFRGYRVVLCSNQLGWYDATWLIVVWWWSSTLQYFQLGFYTKKQSTIRNNLKWYMVAVVKKLLNTLYRIGGSTCMFVEYEYSVVEVIQTCQSVDSTTKPLKCLLKLYCVPTQLQRRVENKVLDLQLVPFDVHFEIAATLLMQAASFTPWPLLSTNNKHEYKTPNKPFAFINRRYLPSILSIFSRYKNRNTCTIQVVHTPHFVLPKNQWRKWFSWPWAFHRLSDANGNWIRLRTNLHKVCRFETRPSPAKKLQPNKIM